MDFEGKGEPVAYCGGTKWRINPRAHLKKVTDVIREAVAEYEHTLHNVQDGKALESERLEIYEKASRTILEIALVDFDYEKEANNPDAGPALLGMLALDVKDFLLVLGGKEGVRLSRTRLNMISQGRLGTSRDSHS